MSDGIGSGLEDTSSGARFWGGHIGGGFVILGGEAVASVVYMLVRGGSHRGALMATACAVVGLAVAGVFLSAWVARQSWRDEFSLVATLLAVTALCACAWLDGGLDSPFLYMALLPIMYSALLLRPRAVVTTGLMTLAGVFAVGLSDRTIEVPQESLLMMAAVVAGTFALAVTSSVYRERLEREQISLTRRLRTMAVTDQLTGCLNQHVFHQRLSEEFDRARRYDRPLSLIVCDADLFKSFNDTYGHQRGDRALNEIAQRLRGAARAADVIARIGGDEFAVLMPETTIEEADTLAKRVVEAQSLLGPGDPPPVSIGLAQLEPQDHGPVSLFNRADIAMYSAKASGRAQAVSHPEGQCPIVADFLCPDSRRAAENARREKRYRLETETVLQTLLEEVPVAFALIDADLRVIRTNSTLAAWNRTRMNGYAGLPAEQVMPQWWPTIGPYLEQILHDGLPVHNLELDQSQDQGEPAGTRLANLYPVHLSGGATGIGIVVVDISDRKQLEHSQAALTDAVIGAFASAAEARDPYTAGHQRRVATIAGLIATELGYDSFTTKGIQLAASVHDIGKISIPVELLTKPVPLSSSEFGLLKTHPQTGFDMLAGIEFPWPVAEMVLHHHERLDGSGYPNGLTAEQIGPGSRIIAVADVIEAMATHRPYRQAPGIDAAINEITNGRGKRYDADIVDICIRLIHTGRITLDTPNLIPAPTALSDS